MDLLKLLRKHPADLQALYDTGLNVSASYDRKQGTWSARTFSRDDLTWSAVTGYESPRRAVLHAIRAGVEKRMQAVVIFNQKEVANVQA